MNVRYSLTLDGMLRALRTRLHSLAEDVERGPGREHREREADDDRDERGRGSKEDRNRGSRSG